MDNKNGGERRDDENTKAAHVLLHTTHNDYV